MNIDQLNILVLSDIHLGHNINKTSNIVNNLNKYFIKYNKYIKQCKMIVIAGDIYDTLLVNGSSDFLISLQWLTNLAMYCKKHNIKLRILEGTPSHDWKQASVLNTALKELEIDIDFKYINDLVIEHITEFGINILYIPDEYKHNASETLEVVKAKLQEANLSKVDLAVMHGQFDYQIPMIKLDSSHDLEEYENIVDKFIAIGHIHKHSVNGKVIAQGSFDRLAHNEEEAKGGVILTLNKYGDSSYVFLENTNAMKFITLDYSDIDTEDINLKLEKDMGNIPKGSAVRIWVSKDSGLYKNKKEIVNKYVDYVIKIENKKEKEDGYSQVTKPLEFNKLDSFNITKDNIEELVITEVMNKYDLDIDKLKLLKKELSTVA